MELILEIDQKTDAEITRLFSEHSVALTPDEGRQIVKMLGRNPTLTEATVWGIQGSEHSSYKSSRKYLSLLPTEGTHVLMGPGEDAGIVRFHASQNGETYGIVFAHESHNHPSQVVPFEGAATGVGGICRDIACMGARVIGALDSLRFGEITHPLTKRLLSGVTSGVGGYGNPLGVPNLGGDLLFDESFHENCLVNVVALGILRESGILHSFVPENAAEEGYEFILVGKPTDRSGFGGSSFASASLNEDDREKNKGAVQEPNPFLERHLFAAFSDLFARLHKSGDLSRIAMKDLGAGGVLCATVELVAEQGFGAKISVDAIHVAEKSLPAAVILCAETQERFCFAVPPDLTPLFLEHFNTRWDFPNVSEGARASVIGKVVPNGIYRAIYQQEEVCHAKALDITKGISVDRPVSPPHHHFSPVHLPEIIDWEYTLRLLLASENVASLRPFTETYDQTVQGNTLLTRDETEAVSFAPLRDFPELSPKEQEIPALVSVASPARVGKLCPKTQGKMAVSQAVLKIAAAGGEVLALTDCLNYGNPEIPEQMWEFVEGVHGIAEAAHTLKTPFVSGNVSLYNASASGSVSPSANIGALGKICCGILPRKNAFQKEGSQIFLLGKRSSALGGSEIARLLENQMGDTPPECDLKEVKKIAEFLILPEKGVLSAGIIAEGGAIATLLKMSVRSQKGVYLPKEFSFAEWTNENPGVVVEVEKESVSTFVAQAEEGDLEPVHLGEVQGNTVSGKDFTLFVTELSDIFWNSLRKKQ